jgi:aromatic-L-amino-acid/L-tryptophan decarboxylase
MLPLDPPAEDMRAMGRSAVEYLIGFIQGLDDAPAANAETGLELARRIAGPPTELGNGGFDALMATVDDAAHRTFEYSGPGYLAYIPGGGLYTAAVAEFLAQGLNRYVGLWQPSPAMVQIEENVTRWLCDLFSLPAGSQGLLTTGGSMANFSAVVTARSDRLGEEFLDGTYYVSEQVHASITKAAKLAGFGAKNFRAVATDDQLRIDVGDLRRRIHEDRSAGMRPFLVVASAGTTNTGAVDPIEEVSEVARAEGMWLHVDGAYGGFFQLTERGRDRFRGIEAADSITLDPHKGLFLPYGTGALVVRDAKALREAHHVGADYLQDLAPPGELPNYSEYSPELSRDFRGLRVWMPLQLHGVATFRDALDEKLDLTTYLHEALVDMPEVEVPWAAQLSTVPFRLAGADDAGNAAFLARINAGKRVFLSSTMIHGRYTLRVCIVSHRTHRDRIDECIATIRSAAREA